MAQKKEKKIISYDTKQEITQEEIEEKRKEYKQAKPVGEAKPKRIGAIALWVAAVVFEVLAALVLFGKINLTFMPVMWQLIVFIVLDLACVIAGSQLWKKANHIDPASEANKVKFWLWNNMGVIVCVFAFVPIIILMLANKELDKKTKTIATVVAVIALLIGGVFSYDFNPVSQEQLDAAVDALGTEQVYWAPFGHVYHTHDDCQSLSQSESLTVGTVDQAIAEGRTRLCSFCAKRDNITGVATDGEDVDKALDTTDDEEELEEDGELIGADDLVG
ncbi:MAG: hypothetical protein Q4A83_00575 [Bacillota bacterium]|nr:hypothetical protein [Bacillota bacterium]